MLKGQPFRVNGHRLNPNIRPQTKYEIFSSLSCLRSRDRAVDCGSHLDRTLDLPRLCGIERRGTATSLRTAYPRILPKWHDRRDGLFRDLYLYGGLFDIVGVRLSEIFAGFDVYDIRHILCALIGIAGIAATAATARTISGSRAGFIAAVALAVCGCWYGAMFNHTKDIPLAAGMIGATYMLVRIMRELPRPSFGSVLLFGLLTGCALGIRV